MNLPKLAEAQHRAVAEKEASTPDEEQLKLTLAECDEKLAQYRAALDAGGDPAVIVGWIKETTAIRAATQATISAGPKAPERMSEDQISMIVQGLSGLLGLLRQADPRDKAEIYSRLGLQLTYKPGSETLIAEVVSPAIDGVNNVCPRGNTNQNPTGSDAVFGDPVDLAADRGGVPGLDTFTVEQLLGRRLANPYQVAAFSLFAPVFDSV